MRMNSSIIFRFGILRDINLFQKETFKLDLEVPFVTTWMDLEGISISKISQRRQILYDFTYMWNLRQINVTK